MGNYELLANYVVEAYKKTIEQVGFYYFVAVTSDNPSVRKAALELHMRELKLAA